MNVTSSRRIGLSLPVQKHRLEKQTQKAWKQGKGKGRGRGKGKGKGTGKVHPSHQGCLSHLAEGNRVKQVSKELAVQNPCPPHTTPTRTHPTSKQRVGTWWMSVQTVDITARYSFSCHIPYTAVALPHTAVAF